MNRKVSLLLMGLALALVAALSFREIADGDAGWHLAFGRLIASHGVEFRNALSWTAPDTPWYPTSWLYDVVSYELVSRFGPGGLQFLTLAFASVTILALSSVCRRIEPLFGSVVVLAVACLMLPRVVARPHVASWAVLACVLLACSRSTWRTRAAAVAVIALGSNLHSGAAFAAGVLGLFCLEAAIRERRWGREAAIAVAGVLALMANPGGGSNVRYLLENLHANSLLPVVEMMPASPERDPVFFLMLGLVVAAAPYTRRGWANIAAAAVFALLTLKAVRFAFEFYLLSAPILTVAALRLRERGRLPAAAQLTALVVLGAWYGRVAFDEYRFGTTFDVHGLPIRALRFASHWKLSGRLFNSYHDGGQIEWALPDVPTYLDGRLQAFPPDFIHDELSAEAFPQTFQTRLRHQEIEWAITGAYGPILTGNRLLDSSDWALVYWDEVNEIFLRRDVPRFADVIRQNEFHYFTRAKPPDQTIVATLGQATPDVLKSYESELDRFDAYTPGNYWSLLARCVIATRQARPDTAAICSRADDAPHP